MHAAFATSHNPARIRWNEKYSQRGLDSLRDSPSNWLVKHEELLRAQAKGWALDLACGNGRNAIYLARLGFTVEALDLSDVAISWLAKKVRTQQLAVHPKLRDLESATLPAARYQIILNFNYLQRSLFEQINDALSPSGVLIFETMTRDHIEVLGREFNSKYLLDHNELLHAFSDLRVLHYRETVIIDKASEKPKAVASLVARKK